MVKAKSAGSFLGGILNNPGAIILGGITIGLLFFSGDIRKAFGSFGESFGKIELPPINLPDINFPDFNFPEITFPNFDFKFPDFNFGSNLVGFKEQIDKIIEQVSNPLDPGREEGSTPEPDVIPDTTGGMADRLRGVIDPIMDPTITDSPLVQVFRPADFIEERTGVSFGTEIIVPGADELGLGGGPSFIGGSTTFGDNLIDTFNEVLNIFPFLRANQIDDLLIQNPGLTASQFRLINPIPESSLSSEGVDPPQMTVTSNPDFQGLTPEQIFKIISGL